MVTLKHGALAIVGMSPMTMAFKAKDASMVKQVHDSDKAKVRVENVNGRLTIVKLKNSHDGLLTPYSQARRMTAALRSRVDAHIL